jgi:hypothetical protein
MSTRATYQFKNNYLGADTTVYIHHDGYPRGAAIYFKDAAESGRKGVEGFIAANEGAHITERHEIHGDTEFRYTVEINQLTATHRVNFSDEWEEIFKGTIDEFIDKFHTQPQRV